MRWYRPLVRSSEDRVSNNDFVSPGQFQHELFDLPPIDGLRPCLILELSYIGDMFHQCEAIVFE